MEIDPHSKSYTTQESYLESLGLAENFLILPNEIINKIFQEPLKTELPSSSITLKNTNPADQNYPKEKKFNNTTYTEQEAKIFDVYFSLHRGVFSEVLRALPKPMEDKDLAKFVKTVATFASIVSKDVKDSELKDEKEIFYNLAMNHLTQLDNFSLIKILVCFIDYQGTPLADQLRLEAFKLIEKAGIKNAHEVNQEIKKANPDWNNGFSFAGLVNEGKEGYPKFLQRLVETGAIFNLESVSTPAIFNGKLNLLKDVVEVKKSQPDYKEFVVDLLGYPHLYRHPEMVEFLLDQNPEMGAEAIRNALHEALRTESEGAFEVLKRLVSRYPTNKDWGAILSHASKHNQLELVREIVEQAKFKSKTRLYIHKAFLEACQNSHLEVARFLVQSRAFGKQDLDQLYQESSQYNVHAKSLLAERRIVEAHKISFTSHLKLPKSSSKIYQFAEKYFSVFSKDRYVVEKFKPTAQYIEVKKLEKKPKALSSRFFMTLLTIFSFATVVIPIIALIARLQLRSYSFHTKPNPIQLS